MGYGYLKSIRESSPIAFDTIMLGDKAWLFLLLMIWVAVMTIASTAYFVHKPVFAVKPTPTLHKLSVGALGFMALFAVLNIIPADANLMPQIGLSFPRWRGHEDTARGHACKYIGLIGLMLVGFIAALYLRATATGFQWGRASRWSQFALIVCAVTVVLTMVTMGYTRDGPQGGQRSGVLDLQLHHAGAGADTPRVLPGRRLQGVDSARLVATGVSLARDLSFFRGVWPDPHPLHCGALLFTYWISKDE